MNARLTLRRDEVVCAGQGCGTLIATVRTSTEGFRQLEMPPGWYYPSATTAGEPSPAVATWEMSKRAKAAAEGFRAVKDRRHHQDKSLATSALRAVTKDRVRGRILMALPARARCPHCGKVNVLDAKSLDVIADQNTAPSGFAG